MNKKLILASQSPRRKELMAAANLKFTLIPAQNFQELPPNGHAPEELVLINAKGKAQDIAATHSQALVIGVDTIGVFQGEILEKPVDEADAFRMLTMLQGQSHHVLSAICLIDADTGKEWTHIESTEVTFMPLTEDEIRAYIRSGEPMDKAASYAIQGRGALFVKEIKGSYSNVVGLPMAALFEGLKSFDIKPLHDLE